MSGPLDRSTRLARWWVRRYTAGLAEPSATYRRIEVDSDLVEHHRYRHDAGWSQRRIARERTSRLVRGAPADVLWRRELLRVRASHRVSSLLVTPITTVASLLLAAYYLAFAAYLLGSRGLADQQFWGQTPLQGFHGYEEESGRLVAVVIIGMLGALLALAALARPISPIVANIIGLHVGVIAVMFFWLGVWSLGLVVVAGSAIDLVTRLPRSTVP